MVNEGIIASPGQLFSVNIAAVPVPAPVQNADDGIDLVENVSVAPRDNPDSELLEKIAGEINSNFRIFNTSISFSVDNATGNTVIKILDRESEKVIREIPPSEMLKLAAKFADIIGRLIDETV